MQVVIKFGTRLDDLIVKNRQVLGVVVSDTRDEPGSDNKKLSYDAVVLAVGHSARDVYRMLLKHEADMVPKDFAVRPPAVLFYYLNTQPVVSLAADYKLSFKV